MRRLFLALAAACSPTLSIAQEGPPTMPTRDVAVSYRAVTGQHQMEMRISWLVAEQKMRMDMQAGMPGYMIVDQRAQRAVMVMEPMRAIMELPFGEAGQQAGQLPATARFVREGTDRVAGQPCTVWRFENEGQSGRACVTQDGVMLRGTGGAEGQQGTIEAIRVEYGPQDPVRFRPPPGYQRMQMPTMPPTMAPGGGGPGRGR